MKIYRLEFEQELKMDINKCWDYFSNPNNLEKITPKDLSFKIISGAETKMCAGQIIIYKIKLFGIFPMNWVTEITQVKENNFFIDEQRFGPYKFWHHQHIFEQKNDMIIMRDIIHYGIKFSIFGRLANYLFVSKKLKQIFEYRKSIIDKVIIH